VRAAGKARRGECTPRVLQTRAAPFTHQRRRVALRAVETAADSPEVLERFHSALPLVEQIAHKVGRSIARSVSFEELVSWGQFGLLLAARRFDPSQEVPFRAFASYRVKGAMIDELRKLSHLPRRVHQRLRMLSAADEYSESAAAEVLSAEGIPGNRADAQRLLDEHMARMATAMAIGLVGQPAIGDDGQITIADRESPEDILELEQLRQLLRAEVNELPEQEAELVRRHYFEGERFDHVAADLGLSKSWASRLHTRAVGRLTKRMRPR
jgi:RNA polymerase sigma factor FliA